MCSELDKSEKNYNCEGCEALHETEYAYREKNELSNQSMFVLSLALPIIAKCDDALREFVKNINPKDDPDLPF